MEPKTESDSKTGKYLAAHTKLEAPIHNLALTEIESERQRRVKGNPEIREKNRGC